MAFNSSSKMLHIVAILMAILTPVAWACDCSEYTITLIEPASGVTTADYFKYRVCSDRYADHDISHWTLDLPSCISESDIAGSGVIDGGSSGEYIGPKHGGPGIKFDVPILKRNCKEFWIQLNKQVTIGSTTATVKAGQNICTYNIRGPVSCPPPPCCNFPTKTWCEGDEEQVTYTYVCSTKGKYVIWKLDSDIVQEGKGQSSPITYQVDWTEEDPKNNDPYILRLEIWSKKPSWGGHLEKSCEGITYIFERPVIDYITVT